MQQNRYSQLILCAVGVSAFACGGRPTIEMVKEHFQNPTGSTSDKTSVITATAKQDASEPAQRVAGNGAGFGFGLTAVGKEVGLERLQARTMFEPELRQLRALAIGKQELALEMAEMGDPDPCVDEKAVAGAIGKLIASAIFGGGSGSADFEYEVDLEECTMGALTGSMSVSGEIELSANSFKFLIEQELDNVCEVGDQKICIDGEFAIEMAAQGDEMMNTGSVNFTTAWFVTSEWDQDGERLSVEVKGGLQLAADEANATLEILVFVVDSEGNEESFVLRMTADSEGNTSFEIRGKDGSLSCETNAEDMTTSCVEIVDGAPVMGEAKISWTSEEEKEIRKSEAFAEY